MTFYRDVKCKKSPGAIFDSLWLVAKQFLQGHKNKKSSIKLDYLVPRGGLEPPRREALTPEASVSTNSTTEAYAADAVHIMRRTHLRQPDFAKNPTFLY